MRRSSGDVGGASPASFSGPTDPVLVMSASTGGHLQAIERFAFAAVRRAGS
jgi:hypothetical protein